MKRLLMLMVLSCSLAGGWAIAADPGVPKAAQSGKKVPAVNATTKTLQEKGRYHAIHTQKEKLDCNDCHGGGADDILFLRTGEFQGKEGPVDRKECLTCHQTPKKPTFYGTAK